jgi:hypothetical protein
MPESGRPFIYRETEKWFLKVIFISLILLVVGVIVLSIGGSCLNQKNYSVCYNYGFSIFMTIFGLLLFCSPFAYFLLIYCLLKN